MPSGWIKIHRSLMDNDLWNCERYSRGQAWIDLIMMANREDKDFPDGRGHVIHGKRGCVYRSIGSLAERWEWSEKKVSHFLSELEELEMIKVLYKSTAKGTAIFLVNYSIYQDQGTTKGTTKAPQKHRRGTAEEPQTADKQEVKNRENNKEKENRPPGAANTSPENDGYVPDGDPDDNYGLRPAEELFGKKGSDD